jgi:formylglycine-generating enzyme required for sulfatase activity
VINGQQRVRFFTLCATNHANSLKKGSSLHGSARVYRGGRAGNPAVWLRVSARSNADPSYVSLMAGFRVVLP